jgi:catechol 2,3-dioxygenase-like lactoylglutathione lyase family enzyme
VPDIRSKQMDESRAFYVDFLGFNVGMDMGFITTFVSPSNPTSQITILHDDGSSALLPKCGREIRIAVGTHIAMRPPHKAVRAAFPHTASTSGI